MTKNASAIAILIRRTLFWSLLSALVALTVAFRIRVPYGHFALQVWVCFAILVLLLWCVVYVSKEILLVRLALVVIGLVFATIVFQYIM
jgi:hypothetical protein